MLKRLKRQTRRVNTALIKRAFAFGITDTKGKVPYGVKRWIYKNLNSK
jgi:hypothetical protein